MSHREVAELLPWYVNATLAEDERRAVDEHLPSCAECARELEQLRRLQAPVHEIAETDPMPHGSSLARVHAEIERRTMRGWRERWDALPAFARLALAVQLGLIVGLATLVLARVPRGASFQTVAGPSVPGVATDKATIVVGFVEGASEAALRRTLQRIEATIVAGPSTDGLYTVALPLAPQQDEAVEAVLQRLRADRAVVRLAARRY